MEEAVSRMEKPTESNAEKYRNKKTKKHALGMITKRSSLSDIRVSVDW